MQPGQFSAYRRYGDKGKPVKLIAKKMAGDIRIMPKGETNSNNFIFKFRFKKRNYKDGSGQYVDKIMIETGKLTYAK